MSMSTPEQAAAKVLGEEIRLLTQLQELAGNPKIFALMCRIVDEARPTQTVRHADTKAKADHNGATAPNGLTEEVLDMCEFINSDITVARVVELMNEREYKFVSKEPKVAVGDVIRRYTGKKLKIQKRGSGREPHVYRWIEEQANAT